MPERPEPVIKHVALERATFRHVCFDPAQVNFFFGRNGTGKSTIARAIAENAGLSWRGGPASAGEFRILLFDRAFIEANFRQAGPVPGVFVLNARNAALREEIAQLERQRQGVVQAGRTAALAASRIRLERLHREAAERCWDATRLVRKAYAAAQRGLKTKVACLDSLLALEHPEPVDEQTLGTLYGEVFGTELRVYPLLSRVPNLDRHCGLLAAPLASGDGGPYAALVKAIGAADWVREGLERFVPRAEGACPFCQTPLAEDFAERAAQCFDEAWHRDFAALQAFRQSYAQACSRSLATLRRNLEDPPPALDMAACRDKVRLLEQAVGANLAALDGKLASPLSQIQLHPLDGLVAEINGCIDRANAEIGRMNGGTALAARRRDLSQRVRSLMAMKARECLDAYVRDRRQEEEAARSHAARKQALAGEYLRLTAEIAGRRKACTGTREAADAIGAGLRAAGFEGFALRGRPGEEDLYELIRPGGAPAENLSEGERSFVAFLYFCHLARSGMDSDGSARPTVAVLDDPSAGLDGQARQACARMVRWMAEDCLLSAPRDGRPPLEQLFVFSHDAVFHRLASAPLACAPGVARFVVQKRQGGSSVAPQQGRSEAWEDAEAELDGLLRP